MSIKLTVDLSDATFAEVSAVIGYAHQLGVDPDEKLSFEGSVLSIEFDGDLQQDDIFASFDDDDEDTATEDGPLYVDDIVDAEEDGQHRRHRPRPEHDPAADLINEVGDAVKNIVDGFILGADRPRGRGFRGRGYGNFGPFGPGPRF